MKSLTRSSSPAEVDDRRTAEAVAEEHAPRFGRVAAAVFAENIDTATVKARRAVCGDLRGRGWSGDRIGRAIGRSPTAVMRLLARASR